MRKIGFILILVLVGESCSVRKRVEVDYKLISENMGLDIDQILKNRNITNSSFFIQKAEFSFTSREGSKRGVGSIKFEWPDRYLISIKSRSGIEGARILATSDSLFVNDRINRKFYYGSMEYIKNKFGIATSLIPILLGDFVREIKDTSRVLCREGVINILGTVDCVRSSYVISCISGKSIMTELIRSTNA